jgi:hypothetical protein
VYKFLSQNARGGFVFVGQLISGQKRSLFYRPGMQSANAGAGSMHPPGPQRHYDPVCYAAQVTDLDGYSLEFVYKSWQHGKPAAE